MYLKEKRSLVQLGLPFNFLKQEGLLELSIREFEPIEMVGNVLFSNKDNKIKAFANIIDTSGRLVLDTQLEWYRNEDGFLPGTAFVDGKESNFEVALDLLWSAMSLAQVPIFKETDAVKDIGELVL